MLHPQVSGRGSIEWASACKAYDKRCYEFRQQLIKDGVIAFHPDDGWYDPEKGKLRLQYPFFNLGVKPGDTIAVGEGDRVTHTHKVTSIDPEDKDVIYFSPVIKEDYSGQFDAFVLASALFILLIYALCKLPIYP